MIFQRTDNNFATEVSTIDFIETAIVAGNANAKTHSSVSAAVYDETTSGSVTFNIPDDVYTFIAYNSGRQRKMDTGPYTDFQAIGKADARIEANVPIEAYHGQLDITEDEINAALSGVEITNEVTFTGTFYTNASYFLRIECGVRDADIYLIEAGDVVDPVNGDRVFIDSVFFTLGAIESDKDNTSSVSTFNPIRVTHSKVALIEGTATFEIFSGSIQVMTELISSLIRTGEQLADIRDIYTNAIIPFKKFGFVDFTEGSGSFIPHCVYGIVNSANAFAIVDMNGSTLRRIGRDIRISGDVNVKWIVGDINWPVGINFSDTLKTFDGTSDSSGSLDASSKWTEFGPINGEYIGNNSTFNTECMHSWQDRTNIGIKKTPENTIGL